jgi:hypothetical protein
VLGELSERKLPLRSENEKDTKFEICAPQLEGKSETRKE